MRGAVRHAQVGHEGLQEDGRRDLQAGGRHDLADAVGQEMPPDDTPAGGAQGPGGGHILLLLELEDLAADDAAHADPVEKAEGDEHGDEVGTHRAHELRQGIALMIGDEFGQMGAGLVEISRMTSTSGTE